MPDIARVFLQCGGSSIYGPSWSPCNCHITIPLMLGPGNDFTIDAEGWTVQFDDDEVIVRCPNHNIRK